MQKLHSAQTSKFRIPLCAFTENLQIHNRLHSIAQRKAGEGEGNREDKQSEQDFHVDDVRDFEDTTRMCLFIEDIYSMFEYVWEEEARMGSESFTNEAYIQCMQRMREADKLQY